MHVYTTLPSDPFDSLVDFLKDGDLELFRKIPHQYLEGMDLLKIPTRKSKRTVEHSMTRLHCFSVLYKVSRPWVEFLKRSFGIKTIAGIEIWSPGIYIKEYGFAHHKRFPLIDLVRCMEKDLRLEFIWRPSDRRRVMRHLKHHNIYIELSEGDI